MSPLYRIALVLFALLAAVVTRAELPSSVEAEIATIMPKVVAWRRDFHEHPELSNQEFRTAEKVAEHLERLGM